MEKKKKAYTPDSGIFKGRLFITGTPEQTRRLGKVFAKKLKKGDIVFLKGDLGSGKTTFIQGIVKAFGNKGFARSSSFIIANEYKAGECSLYHLDLYRLAAAPVWDLGLEEYLFSGNIAVIEWPDRLLGLQNASTWNVEIENCGGERKIKIEKRK